MTAKRRIAIYIGGRANYSSAKPIMRAIKSNPNLELVTVLAAASMLPRYGDLHKTLELDGFSVDYEFNSLVEGETPCTMAQSIGLALIGLPPLLQKIKPFCTIAIGDRFDVLAWVIGSAMMNIPIAHTMGGERTGTIDESIRHSISKFAHIHFVANDDAKQRLTKMGEDPKFIFNVGCPRNDLILECLRQQRNGGALSSDEIFKSCKGVGNVFDLCSEPFILASYHPVTTEFGDNSRQMNEILNSLDELRINTVMIWPNADAGSEEISKVVRQFREARQPDWLHLFVNLPVDVYVQLMDTCACMIGNSSSAIREGSLIGVPAVNIGTRQNLRVRGNNILDVEPHSQSIKQAIQRQMSHGKFMRSDLYGSGDASSKIANILSYIEIGSVQKLNSF